MTDTTATQQGSTGGGTAGTVVAGTSDIVVDKNKTAEQYIIEAEEKYIIPKLVREKFPDLVKLIYETESMNQEEREYWMQILPIMTEDQIVKFREILVNEKEQLEKLDTEYASEMSRINNNAAPAIDEKVLKEKMAQIKEQEASSESQEQAEEAELLKKLQGLG